ncbi:Uncharacterized protein dnm_090940 [Desulfonema magnum]|uniref:Uncharacterized protein n=1 Tax=Desulfonema magnum TaxID=45655 RepID=A0A975BWE3_9BACT|nr:Uncharacterized protein dnm_090940 [Desulfonema magnum]
MYIPTTTHFSGCVPPFTHPKKISHKATERLRENLCLHAFVTKKQPVPLFTHPKKSDTETS